jgi:hypothetical protein
MEVVNKNKTLQILSFNIVVVKAKFTHFESNFFGMHKIGAVRQFAKFNVQSPQKNIQMVQMRPI